MQNIKTLTCLFVVCMWFQCCGRQPDAGRSGQPVSPEKVSPTVVADQLDVLLPKLKGKNVGLVVNHTALVGRTHLADTLKAHGITIKKVFAPEHGFRGSAADGETIKDGFDTKSGLPVVSLYGSNKKPTPRQLADVDVLIFDIQDVGVRFYTFISTLHYVMEAAAEHGKKVFVLDRPNPNGNYVDGPVLDPALKSFVGIHPIPVVHGVTVGELARMINGEGWLENGVKCDLEVIPVKHWTHIDPYPLSIKPSPNLPNDQAVKLYPSLCLFEGTVISVGRGTQTPFLILGNPLLKDLPFQFTPVAIPGMSNTPPHENKLCHGIDLRNVPVEPKLSLKYLIDFYQRYPDKDKFFTVYFDKLAGTTALRQQIKDGLSEEAIRKTWQKDLDIYKAIRQKYLMYP
jgi:uncharacterized protein YbbC (DUF1343 family)